MHAFSDSAIPAEDRIQHPAASPLDGRPQLVAGGPPIAVGLRESIAGALWTQQGGDPIVGQNAPDCGRMAKAVSHRLRE